jgi:large subunit ribosomal protein L31e
MAKETKQKQAAVETEELAEMPEEEEAAKETAIAPVEEEAPEEVAEAKATAKPKKKKDEDFVEEKFYTIPLSRALVRPPKKRAPRAIQLIKEFINRHMKVDAKISGDEDEQETPQLLISEELNEKIWTRGIEKPPRRIKVRATKDKDGNVVVYLAETAKP